MRTDRGEKGHRTLSLWRRGGGPHAASEPPDHRLEWALDARTCQGEHGSDRPDHPGRPDRAVVRKIRLLSGRSEISTVSGGAWSIRLPALRQWGPRSVLSSLAFRARGAFFRFPGPERCRPPSPRIPMLLLQNSGPAFNPRLRCPSTTVGVRCVFACDGSAERVFGGGDAKMKQSKHGGGCGPDTGSAPGDVGSRRL